MVSIFLYFIAHLCIFFSELFRSFAYFLNELLFMTELKGFFICFRYISLIRYMIFQIFSYSVGCLFTSLGVSFEAKKSFEC